MCSLIQPRLCLLRFIILRPSILRENSIAKYQKFLTYNVHQHGSLKTGPELAIDLFGKKFDDATYFKYLENKYL